MQYTKEGQVFTRREVLARHPFTCFAESTFAELGYAEYTPPPYVPTAEDIARTAAYDKLQADKTTALAYAKLSALSDMTPAEVQTWIDANVTNLATAQDAIKTLAIGLSVLIRREKLAANL